jgi:hypothetical protein
MCDYTQVMTERVFCVWLLESRKNLVNIMTTTVNDLILQSDKGKYSLKGEGMTLELSDDKLNFSCGGNEQTWDVETISEIFTTSNDNAYQLVVCAEKDTVLFSTNNELQLLNSAEALANQLEVRFSEHTGRSVEADEHGMNVIEQIQTFPDRWPHSNAEGTPMMRINRVGNIIQFTIPSELEKVSYGLFIVGVFAAAITSIQLDFSFELYLISLLVSLLPLIAVIGIAIALAVKLDILVANHSIAMDKSGIYIQPKFLGFFGLPSVQHSLSDFKDLDVTDSGSITFLFGDRRMTLNLEDKYQAEWILSEIVDAISNLKLKIS